MRVHSENLKKMPRSGIRVIMDLAAQQERVFHLELGEPGFPTPEHIRRAAAKAIDEGFTKYTPNVGLLSLRQAILDNPIGLYITDFQWGPEFNQPSQGGKS